jgi:hypothetical protein
MKKQLLLFISFASLVFIQAQNVRTSIASGLGTNPLVWDCTCIPFPNDSIIINHAITLNVNFGFNDGAVVINPSGSLLGDSPNRAFAFSGNANFVNHGIFNVARVAFAGGTAISNGTFTADSFYTAISTNAGWISNGDMNINYSYWNTGKFTLGAAAELIVEDNFYNGDSLISGVNAVLVNNGAIRVNGDFANTDTMRGSGQVCIYGNSVNLGTITGTLDMCDNTGGGPVDYNFGTIGGSVTTCLSPCNIGFNEVVSIPVQVYPNPSTDLIQIKAEQAIQVMVFDLLGKMVYQSTTENQVQNISVTEWAPGVYTYRVFTANGMSTGKLIKQ